MHPHRSNALRYASAARDAHSRVYGGCAAEAAVSESSGPRVSSCIRAPRYFSPYPVWHVGPLPVTESFFILPPLDDLTTRHSQKRKRAVVAWSSRGTA